MQIKIYSKVLPLKTKEYIDSLMNQENVFRNRLIRKEQCILSESLFKIV